MAAWGIPCAATKGREVGKVGTHLSGLRHLAVRGAGTCPLYTSDAPCGALSVQQTAMTLGSTLSG